MKLVDFLKFERQEIARIVSQEGRPKNIALMVDGTRRMLKLDPAHRDDCWLYEAEHIKTMMHKSLGAADIFFDFGVPFVMGPLISYGNLFRKNFMPAGFKNLLDPLLDEHSIAILKKQAVAVSFYGDLDLVRSLEGGVLVDEYQRRFKELKPGKIKHHILIGLGFSTEREALRIAQNAIKKYQQTRRLPTHQDLCIDYFGFPVPPIDIFIRTNEMRTSGGLTPLLTSSDTQLYVPVSPGIISLSESLLRRILYDYLYNRPHSKGMHEHNAFSESESEQVREFYLNSKDVVLGVGRRVGDVWIHQPEDF